MVKNTLLFDLDGTLWNTKQDHYAGFSLAVKQVTGKSIDQNWYEKHIGMHVKDKLAVLISKGLVPQEYGPEILKNTHKLVSDLLKKHYHHNPAHEAMLAKLKQMGYKIGLCSNASADMVALYLKLSGFKKYFDVIVNRDDVKEGKPHPDEYTLSCHKLKSKPEECLAFEDSKIGAEAATSAGIKVIHVSDPKQLSPPFVFEHILRANLE